MKRFSRAFHSEGLTVKGFLSLSLIFRKAKPYVVEASTFLGDVEGQALLPRIETDFVDVATVIRTEKLSDFALNVKNETSVCVILFAKGYPGNYDQGYVISGADSFRSEKNVFLFHNNSAYRDSDIVTSGGRVLGITALGSTLGEAKEILYTRLKNVSFDGMCYLKNIGLS
jgi:phosphoribosylamine--glycine ligase